jgi:hypothetical protein
MKFEILGIRREQRGDWIWFCPSVQFYTGGRMQQVTTEGRFCKWDEIHLKTPDDEDRFCEKIGRNFVIRYRWTAWLDSIKKFFPFLKPKGQNL